MIGPPDSRAIGGHPEIWPSLSPARLQRSRRLDQAEARTSFGRLSTLGGDRLSWPNVSAGERTVPQLKSHKSLPCHLGKCYKRRRRGVADGRPTEVELLRQTMNNAQLSRDCLGGRSNPQLGPVTRSRN